MMGGQASAFSIACRIYAPKNWHATIAAYALMGSSAADAETVVGTAYYR
jgi:hypothetical protein